MIMGSGDALWLLASTLGTDVTHHFVLLVSGIERQQEVVYCLLCTALFVYTKLQISDHFLCLETRKLNWYFFFFFF